VSGAAFRTNDADQMETCVVGTARNACMHVEPKASIRGGGGAAAAGPDRRSTGDSSRVQYVHTRLIHVVQCSAVQWRIRNEGRTWWCGHKIRILTTYTIQKGKVKGRRDQATIATQQSV
jgi:hypothetical protein